MSMSITVNADASYKTVFASTSHVMDFAGLHARASNKDCWFMSAVVNDGIVLRFGALGTTAEEIAEAMEEEALEEQDTLIDLCVALFEQGYYGVHFDRDADLIEGAPWYTSEHMTRITPLAMGVEIVGLWDLTDTAREDAQSTYGEAEAEDMSFFIHNEIVYCMADVMRVEAGSDLADAGFAGLAGDTAFTSIGVMLSDDSETVDLYRVGH